MSKSSTQDSVTPDASQICFGLSEEADRRSLAIFLQLSGSRDFAELLAERIDKDQIIPYVDNFMHMIRKLLTEPEYHNIFLKDDRGSHHHDD